MSESFNRRSVLRHLAMFAPVASFSGTTVAIDPAQTHHDEKKSGRLKVSLNAYSFNKPLIDGTIKLDDLLEFCAKNNIDGVDLTGYYFPGYPVVPRTNSYTS